MNDNHLQKLRNGKPIKLWDSLHRIFVHIQLNRKDERVCWERWVSKDRFNWVNHNKYLSLKDVANILEQVKENNFKAKQAA